MKRPVLINVSYVVEVEREAFWDADTGYVREEVRKALEKRFPGTLELTPDITEWVRMGQGPLIRRAQATGVPLNGHHAQGAVTPLL